MGCQPGSQHVRGVGVTAIDGRTVVLMTERMVAICDRVDGARREVEGETALRDVRRAIPPLPDVRPSARRSCGRLLLPMMDERCTRAFGMCRGPVKMSSISSLSLASLCLAG